MSYICAKCIEDNRLEPKPTANITSGATCEICWKWSHEVGPLVWVRVLNTKHRGHGPDKEWLQRVKERAEGVSMEDVTAQILAEDAAKQSGAEAPAPDSPSA